MNGAEHIKKLDREEVAQFFGPWISQARKPEVRDRSRSLTGVRLRVPDSV